MDSLEDGARDIQERIKKWVEEDEVQGMTTRRAKGLEFMRVALMLEPIKPVWDLDEAEQKARSLAYVAMTRARDQLLVVHI